MTRMNSTSRDILGLPIDMDRISDWEWALAGVAVIFLLVSLWRLLARRKRQDPQVLHHFSVREYKRRQQQQDPDSTGQG